MVTFPFILCGLTIHETALSFPLCFTGQQERPRILLHSPAQCKRDCITSSCNSPTQFSTNWILGESNKLARENKLAQ